MQSIVRDYWSIWKQFVLHGVTQEDVISPVLMQSWRRCVAHGLDPYSSVKLEPGRETGVINHAPTTTTRESGVINHAPTTTMRESGVIDHAPTTVAQVSSTILSLVRPAMEDLYQFAEGSACVIVFADAEGRIVESVGDRELQEEFKHLGLEIGASWSEKQKGTNALALALHESFPMQLDGAMHYLAALHPLYTSAAPVHDLLGQAVGVLAVIGQNEHCHPHTLGMITAAAQAMSNQLQMQVWLSNANDLLSELKTILQALPEGILLLRRDGVVSQMNTPAGTLLGLTPVRVTGRRLRDVLPLPPVLAHALTTYQPLSDEELVFDTVRGRITCLCTLKPISNAPPETGLEGMATSVGLMLSEPVAADGFVVILRSIERVQKLVRRMTGTHAQLTFANVIGESAALKEALRLGHLAASSNSTVLLHGETGTGKEIFAQSIHNSSARADGPFVAINCAAIPRELINTELFGYESGAFTGADRQGRPGKFEQAHGGTLFLDEIGDMPLDLQTSLLRAIETRTIVRIGGQRAISADVRIIVATHRDLREEARRGNFRSDLYYRLNVLAISIPALRDRADDVPLLVQHFLLRQSRVVGRSLMMTPEAIAALRQYPWPGNVRELENMLERVTYLTPKNLITVEDLPVDVQPLLEQASQVEEVEQQGGQMQGNHKGLPLHSKMGRTGRPDSGQADAGQPQGIGGGASEVLKDQSVNAERQAILRAWHSSNGHMTRAAALLGISRTTLWRKMVKYGLTELKDSQ